jgi:hypothetical protein
MKITNISLVSEDSELANLSFRDPASRNKYVVKGVFGLDADDINSVYYGDSIDGSQHFREARLKSRELVFRVALNPNFWEGETYSSLRDNMYRAIARSRTSRMAGLLPLLCLDMLLSSRPPCSTEMLRFSLQLSVIQQMRCFKLQIGIILMLIR